MGKADEVLQKLLSLQKEHLIDLADAAVVIRDDQGRCQIKQAVDLTANGAANGGMWGILVGLMFMHPLLGFIAGAATGALTGALTDFGIDDDFIRDLGATIGNGTSALFILVRKATLDKVIADLEGYHGRLLHTSLSIQEEEELRRAIEGAHRQAITPTIRT